MNSVASSLVACIPANTILQARLKDALGGPQFVQCFADHSETLPAILRGEIRCTVFAIEEKTAETTLAGIRAIKLATPSHAIVVWYDRKTLSDRNLVAIVRAGASEVASRDVEDTRHILSGVLNNAMQRSHVLGVINRIGPFIPIPIRDIFKFAVESSHQMLDVVRVAARFGITRQTLRNRLLEHRMPLPRKFITWCRLLVASSLLQESGHTLDSVGWQLEFGSGHHLGTVMRRYVGSNVSDMRSCGISEAVESAFLASIGLKGVAAGD